jgi:nucleoside diphosphate kinase
VLERTLVIVKPGYSSDDIEAVHACINDNDFVVVEHVERFLGGECSDIVGGDEAALAHLGEEQSAVFVLEKIGAVDEWRLLMGPASPAVARASAPNTLRARCAGAVNTLRNLGAFAGYIHSCTDYSVTLLFADYSVQILPCKADITV